MSRHIIDLSDNANSNFKKIEINKKNDVGTLVFYTKKSQKNYFRADGLLTSLADPSEPELASKISRRASSYKITIETTHLRSFINNLLANNVITADQAEKVLHRKKHTKGVAFWAVETDESVTGANNNTVKNDIRS